VFDIERVKWFGENYFKNFYQNTCLIKLGAVIFAAA
jgi:hypothetical protein